MGRKDRLRMQRRRHVDAARISVAAFEADIFCGFVRADPFEESSQRDAGPLADIVPAFDANKARDLCLLRKRVKRVFRPGLLVLYCARQFETPCRAIDWLYLVNTIERIEP